MGKNIATFYSIGGGSVKKAEERKRKDGKFSHSISNLRSKPEPLSPIAMPKINLSALEILENEKSFLPKLKLHFKTKRNSM
jgi:hypothetical protein